MSCRRIYDLEHKMPFNLFILLAFFTNSFWLYRIFALEHRKGIEVLSFRKIKIFWTQTKKFQEINFLDCTSGNVHWALKVSVWSVNANYLKKYAQSVTVRVSGAVTAGLTSYVSPIERAKLKRFVFSLILVGSGNLSPNSLHFVKASEIFILLLT